MASSTPPRVSSIDDYVTARTLLADRYALDREIGRGGMATVYLAEETKHSRQVAIKVLRPDLAATLGAERFLREIGIAARLSHPHLVPLIDSGDAGGLLYYVSSYMDITYAVDDLVAACCQLVEKNGLEACYIRPMLP